MFKFKKYQRAILGPSKSDSLATLEKNFWEDIFLGLCEFFLEKACQKSEILIKRG